MRASAADGRRPPSGSGDLHRRDDPPLRRRSPAEPSPALAPCRTSRLPARDAADRIATCRRASQTDGPQRVAAETTTPPPPHLLSQSSLQLLVAAARHVLDPDAATRAFQTETQSAALHADAHHELDGFVRPVRIFCQTRHVHGTSLAQVHRGAHLRVVMMMITKRRRPRNIHVQRRRTTCTTSSSRLTAARSSTTRPTSGAAHSRTRTSRACRRRGPRPQSGPRPTARRCADRSRAANSPACDPPPLLSLSKFVSCIDDEPDLWSLEASVLQALASMRRPATSKYSHGAAIAIT